MRKTSENETFPWKQFDVCYLYIKNDTAQQIGDEISHEEAYYNAKKGIGSIVAIWPGKWKSDAFLIDDIETFGLHFGCIHEPLPITYIGYSRREQYDTPQSKFIDIYIKTDKHPSQIPNFQARLNEELNRKFGWNIATSKGISASKAYINNPHNLTVCGCWIKNYIIPRNHRQNGKAYAETEKNLEMIETYLDFWS